MVKIGCFSFKNGILMGGKISKNLYSRASTFPDFFCWGICCAVVDLCCLSLIITFLVGKLFLFVYSIYSVILCMEQSIPSVLLVLVQDA